MAWVWTTLKFFKTLDLFTALREYISIVDHILLHQNQAKHHYFAAPRHMKENYRYSHRTFQSNDLENYF